jgi:nicotinate-nucleotide adenylyltransferase
MKKLGILGGTFDPPHLGHLILAQTAREEFELDKIIFIPAGKQPHKQGKPVTRPDLRYLMVSIAIAGNEPLEVSDIEIRRDGLSYMSDTIEELHRIHSESKLFLIIGGDNITDLETWRNPEAIFERAVVVAALRPPATASGRFKDKIRLFNMPRIDISSSMIRSLVKEGRSIKYYVPEGVEKLIREKRLYI